MSEESLNAKFVKYDELGAFIEHNSVGKIVSSTSIQNIICLQVNKSYPLFFQIREKKPFFPQHNKINESLVTCVALSPCGLFAATGHKNGSVLLWDILRKNSVSEIKVPDSAEVLSISFQGSKDTLLVSTNDSKIHKFSVSSLSLFLFMKLQYSFSTPSNITQLYSSCSADKSMQYTATIQGNKIIVYDTFGSIFDEILSLQMKENCSKVQISFINDEWHFYLAVREDNSVTIYKISDSGLAQDEPCHFSFDDKIISISFVSPILLSIVLEKNVIIVNVHEDICATYTDIMQDINIDNLNCCASLQNLMLLPYGCLEIEDFESRIKKLMNIDHFVAAAELAVSIYCGENGYFSCSNKPEVLREQLRLCLLMLVESSTFNKNQFPLVADCITKGDVLQSILQDILKLLKTEDDRLQFCIALLQCEDVRPEVTASVIDELEVLKPYGNKIVEDALLSAPLSPSYIQKAVSIGNMLRFTRFVLHTFDRFFNDILPAFSLIIDTGSKEHISEMCKYVFLSNSFDQVKTNVCIVWLHCPGKGRLAKVFESDWSLAHDLAQYFLQQAPIKFSITQSLSEQEMIKSMFLCFENVKAPEADDLFTLIATKSNEEHIVIPPSSVPTILRYIFASSASRSIRESLFLRIVDIDYKQIDINQFKYHAVRAGFSCVVQRLAKSDEDLILLAQSRLLSDTPEDALELFEQYKGDKDRAKSTLISLFRPLLYLNPKRLVKLVLSKFQSLHSKKIIEITQPSDTKLYFDTLFSINDPPIVTSDDTRDYINFLNQKRDTKHIIEFLRTSPNVAFDAAFESCQMNSLHIGCAVLNCMTGQYQNAFKSYYDHISCGGQADQQLTNILLDNIRNIEEPAPVVIRTVLEPLVSQLDVFEATVKKALTIVDRTDVLIALFSLLIVTRSEETQKFIKKFVGDSAYLIPVSESDADVSVSMPSLVLGNRMTVLSNGKVSVRDYGIGVIVVTTEGNDNIDSSEPMPEKVSEQARMVLQKAEVQLLINKIKIPQEKNATIILMKK